MSSHSIAKLALLRVAAILKRARVSRLIEQRSGICWLAAPAGYGKTTALIDYLRDKQTPYVWFRVDEGDQDIARFFGYLASSLPAAEASTMPVFGAEHAEHPSQFARRFFRTFFARLEPGTILVFDDLHHADTIDFRRMLSVMMSEMPAAVNCICLSRSFPGAELSELTLAGQLVVIDKSALEFSDAEALDLVKLRMKHAVASVDVTAARSWAFGLVLLTERAFAFRPSLGDEPSDGRAALFEALGRYFFDGLPANEQEMLVKINLLPEISASLANVVTGSTEAAGLLERLYLRQLLITRTDADGQYFQLHDLLRDFLEHRLSERFSQEDQARLRERTAHALCDVGRLDDAVELALQAAAWRLARDLILERADALLAQGQRTTFIDWCARMPAEQMDGWMSYWLGVAHMPDDAAAERWLSNAWTLFEAAGDVRGLALAASRAILVKTDSWRTYEGLSIWTKRAMGILHVGLPALPGRERLLVLIGMVRALNFSDEYLSGGGEHHSLADQLLDRIAHRQIGDPPGLRLLASETLIEHSVSTMRADLFEKAVDSVIDDLTDPSVLQWELGMWLVAFGAKSGRYFPYSRRGFPYGSAEDALRMAIAIGERESLRGVEFGALYHLQMQMKFRNDFTEFGQIVKRLADIADSRFTTQVAVVADCNAALHAREGNFSEAYRDCERFMSAIEAANEPMIERWPHYITQYQVLLSDRKPREAIDLLAPLLPRLDGGALKRTELCILAAEALEAKWSADNRYSQRLERFVTGLRDGHWPMILLNLPETLSGLLSDALANKIAEGYCRALIQERRLLPPSEMHEHWPWPLKVYVLGGFRLERDGVPIALGAKPPNRALDILRVLSISRNFTCSVETLQDWLWPDLDGDQAKAACEQALHRLRKLLTHADLVVQREGKLRLATDKVWVELADWERRLKLALAKQSSEDVAGEFQTLFTAFNGPPFLHDQPAAWLHSVAERVRGAFVDLTCRLAARHENEGDISGARTIYLGGLDCYPDSERLYEGLIRGRVAQDDFAGAVADHSRYERIVSVAGAEPSRVLQTLVQKFLPLKLQSPPPVSDP